jgi:hypothetical protein
MSVLLAFLRARQASHEQVGEECESGTLAYASECGQIPHRSGGAPSTDRHNYVRYGLNTNSSGEPCVSHC